MKAIGRLVDVGSAPLGGPLGDVRGIGASMDALEECKLLGLLRRKNGFYAFESALHVFPSGSVEGEVGLEEWNSPLGWRADYRGLADGCFFFAEDIFGVQFCIVGGAVSSFDPETGAKEAIATDVEGWAERILDDYEVLTGYALAHEWQTRHGALPRGHRLVPKVPFVTGGELAIDNLFLLESSRAMRSRANLAVQIRDLPDGTPIRFEILD